MKSKYIHPRPEPIKNPWTIGGTMPTDYDGRDAPDPIRRNPESTNTNRSFKTQAFIVGVILGCIILGTIAIIWAYATGGQPTPF